MQSRFRKQSVLLLILLITVSSQFACKKNTNKPQKKTETFNEVFEEFWRKMNSNYSFWDVDKTNWDSLYLAFKPKFLKLNIKNETDLRTSVAYFKELTKNLIDSHYIIKFHQLQLADSLIYPSYDRYRLAGLRNKYDFNLLASRYLDSGSISNSYYYEINNDKKVYYSRLGKIDRNILYFSCSSFAAVRALRNKDVGSKKILDTLDNYLINKRNALKGIIFDLRGNAGGDVDDLNYFVSRLSSKEIHLGNLKYKNGDGRIDFTPSVPVIIKPHGGPETQYPVVLVLIDSYSASLSELLAMSVSKLPKGKIIGEPSWGATGPVSKNSVYGYGSFEVGDFMSVEMANGQLRNTDGELYEGKGIKPDIDAPFILENYRSGIDSQLEIAINYLRRSSKL